MKKTQKIVWEERCANSEIWTRYEGTILRNYSDYRFYVEMDGKRFWMENDRIVIQVLEIK